MRCYNMFQFSFFLSLAVFVCGDKFESLFSTRIPQYPRLLRLSRRQSRHTLTLTATTSVTVNSYHHNDIDGDYVDDGEFATPCLST